MPVKPQFEWEQTVDEVLLQVTIKGFKKDAIDVLVSSVFAKINAPPTYLLTLDLLHPVDPEASTHYMDSEDASLLHLRLRKSEPGLVWDALCVNSRTLGKKALLERREASMKQEEQRYNEKLQARRQQQESEKRRMTEEQWEVEKKQRNVIEERVQAERTEAEEDLYAWEDATTREQRERKKEDVPRSPADIAAAMASAGAAARPSSTASAAPPAGSAVPQVRQAETVNVTIDFTPKAMTLPTRSRGDEEYYRRSRYKPVSVEDSPMFWKDRADKYYKAHDWKAAADAYSESIKRDGVFLTCVMNRAACNLQLAEYKKAIEDCTLALTMLANTPASEVTQERYRALMTKLHARRGAAYCWADDLISGVSDLRMAAAYCDPSADEDVAEDLARVEALMVERGISDTEKRDPLAARMQEASALYYKSNYAEATAVYEAILVEDPYHAQARCNLAASLLHEARFNDALEECGKVISFCGEVAEALNQPGALSGGGQADSDDDDELEEAEAAAAAVANNGEADEGSNAAGAKGNYDDLARKRRAAARKISESSGHVYLLLKAYVRGAAALCGMKDYRRAHTFLEQAVRITPYDNDLRDDCNRLVEKVRMDTLVAASAGGSSGNANSSTPATGVAAA